MQLNSRYFIHPSRKEEALSTLHQRVINKLPSREVSTDVVLEHFYRLSDDYVSVEQIYDFQQMNGESLKGKPRRIRLKRESTNATTYQEFGFTSAIDLRKAMEFVSYSFVGQLTQIKIGFILRDPLIELPVTVNETKEFGCFIEIGEAIGAVEDINRLLWKLMQATMITDDDLVTEPYGALLSRARGLS